MYAVTEFHIVSLFSFRALHANAFSARTLPCPTPAAVKLTLLAKLLERDGDGGAQEILDWLAPLGVSWRAPRLAAVSSATVRVYKADARDQRLEFSRGMREYVHMAEPFGLAIGPVPADHRADVTFAVGQIRALGNAESLVQPLAPPAWHDAPPEEFISLTDENEVEPEDGVAVVVDDLGEAPAWSRLNVHRVPDRRLIPQIGADRVRRIIVLPYTVRRWGEAGYVLARSDR
jgi:hypothetical protein